MRDPDLVLRAQQAAGLERAWDHWRNLHGLGAGALPPVSSYVGYSLEEPWGQPRVVFGIAAEEAEQLAALLDRSGHGGGGSGGGGGGGGHLPGTELPSAAGQLPAHGQPGPGEPPAGGRFPVDSQAVGTGQPSSDGQFPAVGLPPANGQHPGYGQPGSGDLPAGNWFPVDSQPDLLAGDQFAGPGCLGPDPLAAGTLLLTGRQPGAMDQFPASHRYGDSSPSGNGSSTGASLTEAGTPAAAGPAPQPEASASPPPSASAAESALPASPAAVPPAASSGTSASAEPAQPDAEDGAAHLAKPSGGRAAVRSAQFGSAVARPGSFNPLNRLRRHDSSRSHGGRS